MAERDIFRFVLSIEQHGVPLIEGCAAGILAAQAHWDAIFHQTGKGQRFGHTVVDRLLARPHLLALLEQLLHLGMDVETFGIGGQALGELAQLFSRDASGLFVFWFIAAAEIVFPVVGKVAHQRLLGDLRRVFLCGLVLAFDRSHALGNIFVIQADLFGVDLIQAADAV